MNGCKKCPAHAKCTETYRGSGCAALRYTYGLESDPKLDCTDREKLIDLIGSTQYGNGSLIGKNFQQGFIAKIADHLLANGVKFAKDIDVPSKWISHMQPPKEWRDKDGNLINYMIYTPLYGVEIGNYMEPAKCWLCMGIPSNVTHWMPLPEPPKNGRQ